MAMPGKRKKSVSQIPAQYFAKELAGETAPSFATLQVLYGLAGQLYELSPWRLLDESNLVLARAGGEMCYCSVMGALGQVYSMHAYIGAESFRWFCRMEAGEIAGPGEFFAQHSVSVEFVSGVELERQDRELLAALGHSAGRARSSPVFRTIRPGFHPWFITAEEAGTLAECMRAVIAVCSAVAHGEGARFWSRSDSYPFVSPPEPGEAQMRIEQLKAVPSDEPAVSAVRLSEEVVALLRTLKGPARRAIELDHFLSAAAIGKKNERKACATIALAVDAATGTVYPPAVADAWGAPGDMLVQALVAAAQANRALPKEIRVRSRNLKMSLAALTDSLGIAIRVLPELPALDQARTDLLGVFEGVFAGGGFAEDRSGGPN